MNKDLIKKMESKLENTKEETKKTLEFLQDNINNEGHKGIGSSSSQVTNHPADIGTQLFEKELDMALINEQRNLDSKIDKALEKIDEGEYGICEECRASIEKERLEILPYTTICASCANERTLKEVPRNDIISDAALENFYDMYDELEERGSYQSEENLINIQSPDYITPGCVEKVEEISNQEYKNQL